jgi:hypothetical protein
MPRLLVYSLETVVAEKLDALVQFGTANSRMKDFYDLFVLARGFNFDGYCWSARSARRSNAKDAAAGRAAHRPHERTRYGPRKTDTVDGVRPEVGRARRTRSSDHHHGVAVFAEGPLATTAPSRGAGGVGDRARGRTRARPRGGDAAPLTARGARA